MSHLDDGQYHQREIARYEAIYGKNFTSPGGQATALDCIRQLELKPGETVLDAGCGLGGSAMLMARQCGTHVDAVDLSRNMIEDARKRVANAGLTDQVRVEQLDLLELEADGAYDAILSRDVFLHIHDKTRLFAVLHRALRPGGRLLLTDYGCGAQPWTAEFRHYVTDRKYSLLTLKEYAVVIQDAGFERVSAEDRTAEFIAIHEREHDELAAADWAMADSAMADWAMEERQSLLEAWQHKIRRAKLGEQRWCRMLARAGRARV